MKISIIIPVYNVEKYLNQCIDSVIRQTYKDLEIILIDDGSTDNSGKICDEYICFDKRVKVIHKSNGGLMSAWKAGFLSSTGRYIGFVDSDDWVDEDMYEQLVNNAISQDADIVTCQLIKEYIESNIRRKEQLTLEPGIYDFKRIRNEIIPGIINDGSYLGRKLSPSRVTKLFKREIIEANIQYCDNHISLGEDLITSFSCVCDAKKIIILSNFFPYHYRMNSESITAKYNDKRIAEVNRLNYKLSEICKYKNINIEEQVANDYISLVLLCIEAEILSSPYSKKIILSRIGVIGQSDLFNESLRVGNTKGFSLKYKSYLYFIKRNKFEIIYTLRKVISFYRETIHNKRVNIINKFKQRIK